MKTLFCVLALAGLAAVGWVAVSRPSACERLDVICAHPSISNLNAAMQCGIIGMMLVGKRNEAQCEAALTELGRARR